MMLLQRPRVPFEQSSKMIVRGSRASAFYCVLITKRNPVTQSTYVQMSFHCTCESEQSSLLAHIGNEAHHFSVQAPTMSVHQNLNIGGSWTAEHMLPQFGFRALDLARIVLQDCPRQDVKDLQSKRHYPFMMEYIIKKCYTTRLSKSTLYEAPWSTYTSQLH